jgi:polysaccharide biosynthesis protein PslH
MKKIIVITPKPAFPKIDGGCIAMATILEGFATNTCDFRVACLSTYKHRFNIQLFPKAIQEKVKAHEYIRTKPSVWSLIQNIFSRSSYFTSRFYSKQFEKKIINLITEFNPDIIHLESLFVCSYLPTIRLHSNAKIVLRTHNIESDLWKVKTQKSPFLKRLYLNFMQKRLLKEEIHAFNNVDGLVCIAPNELKFIKQHNINTPAIHIPTGYDTSPLQSTYASCFHHIGAMDWSPNQHGIEWFVKEVWGNVYASTNVKLHLAGKELEPTHYASISGIINHGEVISSSDFMTHSGILVVPLHEGSGIRIKIIEAGTMAIPVIATKKAVEGLGLIPDVHYLEANTATEFTNVMIAIVNNNALQQKIGENLRDFVREKYNQHHLNQQLIAFYDSI